MSDKNEKEVEKTMKSKSLSTYTPKKEYSKKVGNYILNEKIGIGTFSKVTKAIHTLTGEKVAVKILDKSKIKDNIDIERISREIEILKSISHPNITQLYESNSTIHNFYLIMEYIEGGDLCDYINKNICLNEHISCHFFRQLVSVIEYLYEMGITHRDIKPENILLDSSQQNIKVIDFGLSNYCADTELLQSACGSPCFASPEMLSGNPYNGITTDIWSCGIVLYSMLVGTLPFDDQELNTLYEQIKIGTFYIPSTLSLEAIDFLKKILRVDPNKRINLLQIKEHPWFNIEKNKLYKGIDLTVETFPYNENLIEYVIKKFYEDDNDINKHNFIKMVQYHACNQYTATYYLTDKFLERYKILRDDLDSDNKIEMISTLDILNSKKKENNEEKDADKNDKKKELTEDLNVSKNKTNNTNNDSNTNNQKNNNNKPELKKNSNNKNGSKERNHSICNTINNKGKVKSLVNNNLNKENKKNTGKKEVISYKKSPYIHLKTKKDNFLNNKILSLFPDRLNDGNIKLTHRISTILECINNLKISENNSRNKKTSSWQKKVREKNIIKKNKIINDKNKITRNHFTARNFITEYTKKYDKNNHSLYRINNIRFTGTFMKKDNMLLTDRGHFSNSIFGEEPKLLSFNNSKIQSVKTEKEKKRKPNISSKKKRNISNKHKIKKKNENNSMNISKNNFMNKKEKKILNKRNDDLNLANKGNTDNHLKINFNQHKKKIYIQTNINSEFYKKLKTYNNNYILTGNNNDKKESLLNKIKFPDSTHSSLHMKKAYLDKKINSHNNTINKYKELVDEFSTGHSENKNKKTKLKKVVSKLESEYFSSANPKYGDKLKFKNRNKNSLYINSSQNHSLSKTKTLNNMSNNNINTLSPNNTNNVDDSNKAKPTLLKNALNSKKKSSNKTTKNKLFQPLKYKKDNLKININGINYKVGKSNNVLGILSNKRKNKNNNINNSSKKKNYTSFINTTKNSATKKIRNPFTHNISMSPDNSNNNIKNTEGNNKKIINININNILKINKKYSISLTKSNDSSKHSIYYNNNNTETSEHKNLLGLKNYNSSYPLVTDKNNKYKGAIIKCYTKNNTCKNQKEVTYPKIKNDQNNNKIKNKNYSSMLKRQLFEEQLFNKNNNF